MRLLFHMKGSRIPAAFPCPWWWPTACPQMQQSIDSRRLLQEAYLLNFAAPTDAGTPSQRVRPAAQRPHVHRLVAVHVAQAAEADHQVKARVQRLAVIQAEWPVA